ncbi:GntP family permease [Candidatus Laterigemmans baculatus]|uniref:GntP family permease n=1 Tax=Candidatus Laterigemmans baculatus TaxID=2770505 RepID=UPI001F4828E4|nr:SLC13 family permease [Candidatus Laterigemmans baculatus]
MKLNVWVLVSIAIVTVLVSILWLRLHAFLALMLAGLLVAVGTPPAALQTHAEALVERGSLEAEEVSGFVSQAAPARLAAAFGKTAGQIGILIALASIIGACLLQSGAARVIIEAALGVIGQRHAAIALAASSFVLGIPVFFDTVFYLMVPLARTLRQRTGRDYVLFILAIMAGGSIAHSLVPPTPGPLQIAEIIGVDLLTLMLAGLVVGGLSSTFSLGVAWWLNRRVDVPLRSLGEGVDEFAEGEADLDAEQRVGDPSRPRRSGPPVLLALAPILLPVLLIAGQTATKMSMGTVPLSESATATELLVGWLQLLGDKNVALGIATAIALAMLYWAPPTLDRSRLVSAALASGGVIILITSAGGAFGAMLGQAGIAEAMSGIRASVPGLMLLPIAFAVTTAIRTLQGSATVAMITAAGILQGLAAGGGLPFHPVYLALAIGAGSKPVSWMNDSGFWVMCKMSGMTESEGLRTISPFTVGMGLSTLFWTMLGAWLVPLV